MEKTFGPNGFTILELPTGSSISSERFTEFEKAFEYYQNTESFEKQIEQRFAGGTKPLVLTEGSTDVHYIQTALALLGKQKLLNSLDIEFVGIERGSQEAYGGDKGLNNFRNVYVANSSLFHRPILLLYDCDTQKPDEQVEQLRVRAIPRNIENTKVTNGIENLFSEDLFGACFYREYPGKDGGYTKRLDKNKFCNWICGIGDNADDFATFDAIVEILEQFIAAHQAQPVQQG